MNKLETPLFNNSCGKIFKDKIILASKTREDEVEFDDIKKVRFGITTSLKSVMWALLPSSIFVLLYMERKKLDSPIFFLLSFVAIAITVVALVMAEKSYYIHIRMSDGLNLRVRVSPDNKKDAKKFAELCVKTMARAKSTAHLKVVKSEAA